jgi:hypothetical protein
VVGSPFVIRAGTLACRICSVTYRNNNLRCLGERSTQMLDTLPLLRKQKGFKD